MFFWEVLCWRSFYKSLRKCLNRCQRVSKPSLKKPAQFQPAVSICQFLCPGTTLYWSNKTKQHTYTPNSFGAWYFCSRSNPRPPLHSSEPEQELHPSSRQNPGLRFFFQIVVAWLAVQSCPCPRGHAILTRPDSSYHHSCSRRHADAMMSHHDGRQRPWQTLQPQGFLLEEPDLHAHPGTPAGQDSSHPLFCIFLSSGRSQNVQQQNSGSTKFCRGGLCWRLVLFLSLSISPSLSLSLTCSLARSLARIFPFSLLFLFSLSLSHVRSWSLAKLPRP